MSIGRKIFKIIGKIKLIVGYFRYVAFERIFFQRKTALLSCIAFLLRKKGVRAVIRHTDTVKTGIDTGNRRNVKRIGIRSIHAKLK